MLEIHRDLIESYYGKKEIDDIKSFDVTDYRSVFEYLASLYRNYCYSYRIVVSPTGCKMHTISCALLKLCCPDVHIEYPTPESYLFEEYSSDRISVIHEINITNLPVFIEELANEYSLNG